MEISSRERVLAMQNLANRYCEIRDTTLQGMEPHTRTEEQYGILQQIISQNHLLFQGLAHAIVRGRKYNQETHRFDIVRIFGHPVRIHTLRTNSIDDLYQAGVLHILEEFGKYDTCFPLYPWLKSRTLKGMLNHYVDTEFIIRIPPEQYDKLRKFTGEGSRLPNDLCKKLSDIIAFASLTHAWESIEEIERREKLVEPLTSILASPEDSLLEKERRGIVKRAVQKIRNKKKRNIVREIYGLGKFPEEGTHMTAIAERLGVSRQRIKQHEYEGLDIISRYLERRGIDKADIDYL